MRNLIYIILVISLFSCDSSKKPDVKVENDCDNRVLVDYVFPLNNYFEEKTLVYSLSSNQDSVIEFRRVEFGFAQDSIFSEVSRDSFGTTNDSTIIRVIDGVPETLESYTRVPEFNSEMIPTRNISTGRRFCEFATYHQLKSYSFPTGNGVVFREFEGNTTHLKYVKRKFNGIDYQCAIIESIKTLTATFNGVEEKLNGTWKGCNCKGLGELYSVVTLENGVVVEQQLEEIIE